MYTLEPQVCHLQNQRSNHNIQLFVENYGNVFYCSGFLAPSALIVCQNLSISCLISLVTKKLIAAMSSFCIVRLMTVAFRGLVLVMAGKRER